MNESDPLDIAQRMLETRCKHLGVLTLQEAFFSALVKDPATQYSKKEVADLLEAAAKDTIRSFL